MTTALAMIMARLQEQSECPLICRRDKWFNGGEVRSRITLRAANLAQRGLKPGDTALILVSDNFSAIETLLGCWMLGVAGCLVDFRTPRIRIDEWIDRLKPSLVISQRPVAGVDLHVQGAMLECCTEQDFEPADRPDSVAIIFASSGTTGEPKLHPRQQDELAQNLIHSIDDMDLTADGSTLSTLSVAYSASCSLWLSRLAVGKPIIACDLIFTLGELDTALMREDVSECALPPIWIRRLNSLAGAVPRYPQLKRLVSVGGPITTDDMILAVTRLSPQFRVTYSCVGLGRITRIVGPEILEKPGSCGRPADGVQVSIWNRGRHCAANEIGEISVSKGGIVDARPGDLGWLDEDGYLYVSGRTQGLLSRNGVNFSSMRIVQAALSMPELSQAVVVPEPDADGGDKVHLFVECSEDVAADLVKHLKRILPSSEQPDDIHVLRILPLNAAGKIDTRSLADLLTHEGLYEEVRA